MTKTRQLKLKSKKLTRSIALSMAKRIEVLEEQIAAVYAEANEQYAGMGNSNLLRDVVKAREAERNAAWDTNALLEGFDTAEC